MDQINNQTELANAQRLDDLKDYTIKALLGQGGMGSVYRAWDARLERHVAIKIINLDTQDGQALKEARILARLNHPNIVHIYDVIEQTDNIALIMEYVQGATLHQVLHEQVTSLTQKLQWLSQISEALAAAHQADIIHCDLKLANILISEQNNAKITDFGISQFNTAQPTDGQSYGSLAAMSPEQLQKQHLDHRSDLFSLGMLAFELIAGKHPFGCDSTEQIAQRIIKSAPMDAAHIMPPMPLMLTQLLNQLLAKKPEHRPQNTSHVTQRFNQILISTTQQDILNQQTGAMDTDTVPLVSTKPIKNKIVASVVTAVLVVLVTVLLTLDFTNEPLHQIAVLRPVFITTDALDPIQKDLVMSTIDDALRQSIVNTNNMRLISHSEVLAIKGGVKTIGKATGATDIITTELDCNNTRCNVTFSRLGGKNWAVQSRQQWPTQLDSYTAIYSTVQPYFATLFPEFEHNEASQHKVNERDYLTYIRLYDQKASVEVLEQLKQVLTRSPYLFAGYRLFRETARDLYDQTQNPAHLTQAHQMLQEAPPEYRYSVFQALDAFWLATIAGDLTEAKNQLEIAQKRGVDQSTLLELRAHWFQINNAPKQSITHYKEALKLRPSTVLLYNLALGYWSTSNLKQAKKMLKRLLDIAPKYHDANQLLASIYLHEGDITAAITAFERIIETQAQSIDLTNLSVAYALNGQYEKSLQLAEQAVVKSPAHPAIILNLADAQMIEGKIKQAQASYQQVITLHKGKKDLGAWLEKAQAFVHTGAGEDAIKALNSAKQLAPQNTAVAFTAALVYAQLDEDISAVAEVETALTNAYGIIWFKLPWFDRLCDSPQFIRVMSDAGNPQRCSH